jgi:hypothetical protein
MAGGLHRFVRVLIASAPLVAATALPAGAADGNEVGASRERAHYRYLGDVPAGRDPSHAPLHAAPPAAVPPDGAMLEAALHHDPGLADGPRAVKAAARALPHDVPHAVVEPVPLAVAEPSASARGAGETRWWWMVAGFVGIGLLANGRRR